MGILVCIFESMCNIFGNHLRFVDLLYIFCRSLSIWNFFFFFAKISNLGLIMGGCVGKYVLLIDLSPLIWKGKGLRCGHGWGVSEFFLSAQVGMGYNKGSYPAV